MAADSFTLRAALLVASGAVLGALSRYVAGIAFTRDFPYGTVVVNVVGSFLIGLFMFGGLAKGWFGPDARLFFAVGFLGALTTMSTFTYDVVAFLEDGDFKRAGLVILLNPVLSLAAAYLGRLAARLIPGGA